MTTIKKKDLKKYKGNSTYSSKKELSELVDADGSPIEGDRNPVSNSEIETAPQATSDDYETTAIQPNNYYRNFGSTPYSRGHIVQAETEIDKIAEAKMKKIIEDLTNKSDDRDMVKRFNNTDVNRNSIPDIEELATNLNKPIVAKKAQELLKTFNMNRVNGEEIGIVLNYILTNIDINDIPNDYKTILKQFI